MGVIIVMARCHSVLDIKLRSDDMLSDDPIHEVHVQVETLVEDSKRGNSPPDLAFRV